MASTSAGNEFLGLQPVLTRVEDEETQSKRLARAFISLLDGAQVSARVV